MTKHLQIKNGISIAFNYLSGTSPAVVFLPGFLSHMQGTKALWLEQQCRKRGQAYVRFDYRGHGESGGRFQDGTISDWLEDALLVLDNVPQEPVIVTGSSMGGWIALLVALERPGLVKGMVGVASAPDFTQTIYENRLDERQRKKLDTEGFIRQQNPYEDAPVTITKKLIEDGKKHLLLPCKRIDLDIPVILIHGVRDTDVTWEKSEALQHKIGRTRCDLILVPDGEHRLSREQDLELIDRAIQNITARILHNP